MDTKNETMQVEPVRTKGRPLIQKASEERQDGGETLVSL